MNRTGNTAKVYLLLCKVKEMETEEDIFHWMRFLGGKTREEFEDMAKKDEYIGLAYEELERMSADIQAKMEYEAREKAIRDYNSQMNRLWGDR